VLVGLKSWDIACGLVGDFGYGVGILTLRRNDNKKEEKRLL
jgi:hypothetical protein